jgi:hypothetical protein
MGIEDGIITCIQQNEPPEAFIARAATEAKKAMNKTRSKDATPPTPPTVKAAETVHTLSHLRRESEDDNNNTPKPRNKQSKRYRSPDTKENREGITYEEQKENLGRDHGKTKPEDPRGKFDGNSTSAHPYVRAAWENLEQAIATTSCPVFNGRGRRSCRLCKRYMPKGYKDHITECDEYLSALKETRCPICMIDLKTSAYTMMHLRHKHFMYEDNPQHEITENDVPLDKASYLEAARKLFSKVPTREYPDHSKYQWDDNQGYSPGEDTDTSTESIPQPGKTGDED